LNKLGVKAFSLVEVLVAAAVVGVAVFSVIAVVRKGQEQMAVDMHRRTARAIVDTLLEAPRYNPGNYFSINDTTITGSFSLDNNLQANDTIKITSQTDYEVPYKKIRVKLRWVEPAGGAVDSVAMERWIPNIPSVNIAPMASSVTSSSSFVYQVCRGTFKSDMTCDGSWSPETYYCLPWSAVDGVIKGSINGDWAKAWNDNYPWIKIKWATPHKIYKIVLHNRTTGGRYFASGANITLRKGGAQVGSVALSSGFVDGSRNVVVFAPRNIDEIEVIPTGTGEPSTYRGFSEIEIYE
jgi:Tfp pilus assembly protein PilV